MRSLINFTNLSCFVMQVSNMDHSVYCIQCKIRLAEDTFNASAFDESLV